jgi:hypothetical protein
MDDDTKNRIKDQTTLDDVIALEDALERKSFLKTQRSENDPQGLYARLKQEETIQEEESFRGLSDAQRLLAKIKEFFGRGPLYEYRKEMEKAESLYSQMTVVSKNLETKIDDVTKRKVTVEKQLILDEAELQTNAVIVLHYERQLADVTARYESARNGSAAQVPATTEAMEGVQEVMKLRQSLSEVNAENNRLAVRILSGREIANNLETQYSQIQRLHQGFEEQRVRAEGYLELARVHDDALKGVGESRSINALYKQTGAAIEVMLGMQKNLKLDAIENLSTEYRVRSPSASYKPVAGKQFWQTLDLFPSSNGND